MTPSANPRPDRFRADAEVRFGHEIRSKGDYNRAATVMPLHAAMTMPAVEGRWSLRRTAAFVIVVCGCFWLALVSLLHWFF